MIQCPAQPLDNISSLWVGANGSEFGGLLYRLTSTWCHLVCFQRQVFLDLHPGKQARPHRCSVLTELLGCGEVGDRGVVLVQLRSSPHWDAHLQPLCFPPALFLLLFWLRSFCCGAACRAACRGPLTLAVCDRLAIEHTYTQISTYPQRLEHTTSAHTSKPTLDSGSKLCACSVARPSREQVVYNPFI